MTPGTLRAYVVCLSFEPPGPVHAGTWLAPDAPSAAALATVHFMREHAPAENLMACLVVEMPAEQLRHYLRAVEGRLPDSGNAEVLSLVPKPGADQESEEEAFARTILSGSAPDYANKQAEMMNTHFMRMRGQAPVTVCRHGHSFDSPCRECAAEQNHVLVPCPDGEHDWVRSGVGNEARCRSCLSVTMSYQTMEKALDGRGGDARAPAPWVTGRFEQTPSRNPLDQPDPPGAA